MYIKELVNQLKGIHDKKEFLKKYSQYMDELKPYIIDYDEILENWYDDDEFWEPFCTGEPISVQHLFIPHHPPADLEFYRGKIRIKNERLDDER